MKVVDNIDEMHRITSEFKRSGARIGFVPTMGYLHDGHASLMLEARKLCDLLVASIFVNPTQFGVNEDLDKYPKNLQGDMDIATRSGVDILFTPFANEIYPQGFQTYVNTEQISLPLCGASRPGHFRGVTTVIAKLFNIINPDVALFGNKDYQQLAVIRQMVNDLNYPVEIIGMPIIRESDGLAMSSRNAYLSPQERNEALCLHKSILAVRSAFSQGVRNAELLKLKALNIIRESPSAEVDYLEFCNSLNLEKLESVDQNTLFALAVKIGKTRLIDNTILGDL